MNEMAKLAYEIYFRTVYKQDVAKPTYEELPGAIKLAWQKVCHAVLKYATNPENID